MDYRAEFERAAARIEWENELSMVDPAINEILRGTPIPPPPPSSLPPPTPAPPVTAGQFNTQPQPVQSMSRVYGGYIPLGAAPQRFEQPSSLMAAPGLNLGQAAPIMYQQPLYANYVMQSGPQYSQAGVYSQGQNLPYQWPVDQPRAVAASYPAVPSHPYYGGPTVRLPGGINQNLVPAGILNGQMVYRIAADVVNPSAPAAAPVNPSASKKKKRAKQQDDDRPYIKKPPNAFMLFRKEQRPKVVAELNVTTSAVVNVILGQRWKSLSKEEQAKYYEEAQNERLLHFQQHPSWSAKENYGKKRKRTTSKAPTSSVEASVSNPGEVPQPAKKICVTPPHTAVTEPSTSLTGTVEQTTSPAAVMEPSALPKAVMEPSTSQAEVMEPCTSQSVPNGHRTAEIPPVSDLYDLLEAYDCHWSDSPAVQQETMEFDYLFSDD